MALADTARLVASLELKDKFSRPAANITGSLGRMERGFSQIGRGAGQVGSGLARLGTIAATAAIGGMAAVVTTAISFEDAFAGVRKTLDATGSELDALQEDFRGLAREIPVSFEELSGIGETAGALGIAKDDILEFTRVVALIGTTTDVTTQDAATSLGQLQNVIGLTADEFDNFGAALVDLGNKGASTESQILAIAARSGAGAKLLGLSAQETLAFASAVANLGIEAEAGGSALQGFFIKLIKATRETDDMTDALDEVSGLGIGGFTKALEKDAAGAIVTLLEGMKKLDRGTQLLLLSQLKLNDIRVTRTLLGLIGDTDNLTASLRDANLAWKENTALQAEAEKRFATTKSQLKLLGNNFRDMGATVGFEVLPVITELSQELLGFLNQPGTQGGIRKFAEDLAGGIRDVIAELRGSDFSGLIEGMKIAGDIASRAFGLFRSLPPGVQALAISAIALNKVSGGAIGQIGGGLANILGGVIRIALPKLDFFSRGSPVNPMFVSVIGGVPGLGGGAAGGTVPGRGGFNPKSLIMLGAQAGVVAAGTLLSQGSSLGTEDLATILANKLLAGMSVEEALAQDAITGAAVAEVVRNTDLMARLTEAQRRELIRLASGVNAGFKAVGASFKSTVDPVIGELKQGRSDQANHARQAQVNAAVEAGLLRDARAGGREVSDRIQAMRDTMAMKLDSVIAKDQKFNFTFPINTYVNASLVGQLIVRQQISAGYGSGPGGPPAP